MKITIKLTIVTSIDTLGNNLFKRKNGIEIKMEETKRPTIKNKVGPTHPSGSPLLVITM